jgi:hypothetical protein
MPQSPRPVCAAADFDDDIVVAPSGSGTTPVPRSHVAGSLQRRFRTSLVRSLVIGLSAPGSLAFA